MDRTNNLYQKLQQSTMGSPSLEWLYSEFIKLPEFDRLTEEESRRHFYERFPHLEFMNKGNE